MSITIRDDRHLRSLTGVTRKQFDILLEAFTSIFETLRQRAYQNGLAAGTRRRRPGGGGKGALPLMRDNMLFVLYYFKVYPTFDVSGTQFGMPRSKANENLHGLCPILYEALVYLKSYAVSGIQNTRRSYESIERHRYNSDRCDGKRSNVL